MKARTHAIADAGRESWFGYCMSKAALNAETQILYRWFSPRGFTVLAVHPGWMRTAMGGAGAPVDPRDSAAGIFKLASKPPRRGAAIYVDYTGKRLRW